MAFVPLVPGTINAQLRQAAASVFKSSKIVDDAGTAVDMSAWNNYTAKIVATSPNPNTADVTFGTVTGDSSGFLTLTTSATDLATVPLGAASLVILGKHSSGDAFQLLASGSLQLSAG